MPSDRPPTPRQLEVLRHVARFIADAGYAPTLKEIGAALDIASTNGVNDHLCALERKGLITRVDMISRGIVVTEYGREWAGLTFEQPVASAPITADGSDVRCVPVTLPARCGVCRAVTFEANRPCHICKALDRRAVHAHHCGRCGEPGHNERTCSNMSEAVAQ